MKVKFEVITPIFSGSGEDYYPNEFFIMNDEIYFLDKNKFLDKIVKEDKLDEFIKVSSNIDDLLDFIDENADESVASDKLYADSEVIDDLLETTSRPISAFIKEKFEFKPIIPGSTLKGVIRTALLDYAVSKQKKEIEEIANKDISNLDAKTLEAIVFCNGSRNKRGQLFLDPTKDILKALFVSDLKPINYTLKAIKPKNKPYKKNKLNSIPVIIESLVNGEFEGDIRIDKSLINRDENLRENRFLRNLSVDLIKEALRGFFKKVVEIENKRFKVMPIEYRDFNIKLGKFAGGGSKSINQYRKIFIRQIKKTFDYQLSVWIYEDMPLGWGRLEFKEEQ
ncbi:type III-A CRISPR-associated RAMP protein Csm5 [Caminibacter mediatlanticus]|uniref:CRISPR system Cms protein Csm5 n=1 Tax=Caminibacter mediatlanticus TB-2 TaxID=391592 RepID=A0AAI9AGL2_9BACT|nr:type III-A CRISPR-associated RAMP protein Csm5 [Caminibacter mediatlanticus]EDM23130.1 hypothetical protein CMTB2_05842 [Caminibacter mediatlanticus TB-2]